MSSFGYAATARLQAQRFDTVLRYGAWVAVAAHVLLILFFAAIGANGMALFNVGSVALYLACLVFRDRLRPSLVFSAAAVEVVGHAWLAVATIGWASGFHYYVFVLAVLGFFNARWSLSIKLTFLALLCLAYSGLGRWSAGQQPALMVDAQTLMWIHDVNVAMLFGFLAYFAHFYAKVAQGTEDTLQRLAGTDALTGLHNRRLMENVAEHEWTRHREFKQPLSLVMVDADDFKALNDRFGHD